MQIILLLVIALIVVCITGYITLVLNNKIEEYVSSRVEYGMDYPGNDINYEIVPTLEDCINRCDARPACKLSVFSPSQKFCWYKTAKGNPVQNPDRHTWTKESNSTTASLPLIELNRYNDTCSRNLSFTKFIDSNKNAAERAVLDGSNSLGSCPINIAAPPLSPEMAIIEENTFTYMLKTKCITLNYKNIRIQPESSADRIEITFRRDENNTDDTVSLMHLLFSNPLFIEFNGSDAYLIDYTTPPREKNYVHNFYFTNHSGGYALNNSTNKDMTIVFKRLIRSGNSANAAFKYPKKPQFTTLITAYQDSSINAKIYYLDNECPVAPGVSLKIPYDSLQNVGFFKLLNKNFTTEIPSNNTEYLFHNKIFQLLQSKKSPVITFEFDINVPQSKYQSMIGKHIEIFNVYLNNTYTYGYCWSIYNPLDSNKNYNILATILNAQNGLDTYLLEFITSGHENGGVCWHDINTQLSVELPYVSLTERISVTVTITPTEKIVLCKWRQDNKDYFVFKRTATCTQNNNFARIFNSNQNAPSHIDDIYVKYSTEFVKNTGYVHLGYTNYMHHYLGTKPNVCIVSSGKQELPSDIDKVFGWSGAHENPWTKNQTAESCRQAALNSGGKYAAWGFRNEDHPDPLYKNTCFLYTKPFKPFSGNPSDKVHQTGCLKPGERVEWGCKTKPQLPDNIDKVYGWSGKHVYMNGNGYTEEDCRQMAIKSNGKYAAWGYRTDEHWDPNWRNTCYLYTAPFIPFDGHPNDLAHTTGCLNPGERVEWGCKNVQPPFKPNESMVKSYVRDNYCLDVNGWGKNDFEKIIMWDCHGGANQRFTYDEKKQLIVKDTGKCLDVLFWGTKNGTPVIQHGCHGGGNQTFEFDSKNRLHPTFAPSKCLTVTGNSSVNGTNVTIEDCHNGDNQKWYVQ